MSRRLAAISVAVVLIAIVASGCAVGIPKPTTYISDTSATLNGDIYSSFAGDTEYWWRYGETTAYGTETPHRTIAISDDGAHSVSEPIGGLTAGTTYHFQLCASDEEEDPPRVVCSSDRSFTTGPAGGRSGIAFTSFRDQNLEIYAMAADGSDQENLTNSPAGDYRPAWSPDATRIAFISFPGGIHVMDADGTDSALVPADTSTVRDIAWSPDGSKIGFSASGEGCCAPADIFVMNPDGSDLVNLTDSPGDQSELTWSPDGSKIAFTSFVLPGDAEIAVMDADGNNPRPLTNNDQTDELPAWSPDGTKIAFLSRQAGPQDIWMMDADGSDPTNLTDGAMALGSDSAPSWSPDGSRIAFRRFSDDNADIWVMDADGANPSRLTTDPEDDLYPAWSPRP